MGAKAERQRCIVLDDRIFGEGREKRWLAVGEKIVMRRSHGEFHEVSALWREILIAKLH